MSPEAVVNGAARISRPDQFPLGPLQYALVSRGLLTATQISQLITRYVILNDMFRLLTNRKLPAILSPLSPYST